MEKVQRVRGNEIGPTGSTVGTNVARVRKGQQLSLQALEARLKGIGRRISLSALSKIENGDRRVDTDDLLALSIALDVSPLGLLLPVNLDPTAEVTVTGARGSLELFWTWALSVHTHITPDERSFIARSIPWWLEVSADVSWHSRELALGVGGAEPEIVETHFSTSRTSDDTKREKYLRVSVRSDEA